MICVSRFFVLNNYKGFNVICGERYERAAA